MEIKATLNKPYTEQQRTDFIVEQNHRLGYTIEEQENRLVAWGYTEEELLEQAKKAKYNEASAKAVSYISDGEAVYKIEEGKSIEATDGNIGKLNAYITGFSGGTITQAPWTTKEDEVIMLDLELTSKILMGIMEAQTRVWTVLYPNFVEQITNATTIEEVNNIVIDYSELEERLAANGKE